MAESIRSPDILQANTTLVKKVNTFPIWELEVTFFIATRSRLSVKNFQCYMY